MYHNYRYYINGLSVKNWLRIVKNKSIKKFKSPRRGRLVLQKPKEKFTFSVFFCNFRNVKNGKRGSILATSCKSHSIMSRRRTKNGRTARVGRYSLLFILNFENILKTIFCKWTWELKFTNFFRNYLVGNLQQNWNLS